MKCCSTLSKKRIISGINKLSFFHSSYFSKLREDKQQTAVRVSLVGRVISVQRLECLTDNPKSFDFFRQFSYFLFFVPYNSNL